MSALATTTRKEACERLLRICEKQTTELDQFLIDVQGTVADKDFDKLRRMVGEIMGTGLLYTINTISHEFPELRPSRLEPTQ